MFNQQDHWLVRYIGNICAFVGAFIIVLVIIGLASGNLEITLDSQPVSKKIVNTKFIDPTSEGNLEVTYRLLYERKQTEITNYEELSKIGQIISDTDNQELIPESRIDWNKEFEPGETIACDPDSIGFGPNYNQITVDVGNDERVSFWYSVDLADVLSGPSWLMRIASPWDEETKTHKSSNLRFFVTRVVNEKEPNKIFVDMHIGRPEHVIDVTYSWIAKGWARSIIDNHPGHAEATEIGKKNGYGIWGNKKAENDGYELGQGFSVIPIDPETGKKLNKE